MIETWKDHKTPVVLLSGKYRTFASPLNDDSVRGFGLMMRAQLASTAQQSQEDVSMMYDSFMRTRLTFVFSIAVSIFGGILVHYEASRPVYAQSRPNSEGLPIITITRDGSLYLNEKPVSINVLVDELKRNSPTASSVYVRPDRNTVWEPVAQVLIALNAAKPPIQARFTLPESPK